ncbi:MULTISPECIES: hypothetical protein [Moorena]|uniref:Uncharacterized protein n=1 Tax=Moorena producens 3L TaxID=489825 RepID=F4XNJ4_9CYAN|nr:MULTISPECIES: hypothetical protein [Moorena]EGJ34253.1 hypothetical protein LYNGBM3L_21750 [Moorena producens 3L]NEP32867.1 hypothetical protein [Moorena sp. SIO3B2]NER90855.1 hypothetical protein [Moorena sp. SIO3A2]NET67323.1 hypothetical protein [Moorena sp. SIO1G6]
MVESTFVLPDDTEQSFWLVAKEFDTPRSKDAGILCSQNRLAQPGRNQEE